MSYILEALRRADAERQRGAVPGLHAQPTPGVAIGGEAAGGPGRLALAVAAVVMVLAGAALAWWWAQQRPPMPTQAAAPHGASTPAPALAMPAAPASGPAPIAMPVPALPAAAPAPLPPAAIAAAPAPLPAVPKPRLVPAAASSAAPAAAPASAAASSHVAKGRAEAAAAAPARLPQVADLPDALRREMAGLSIGGSVWAEQPAARIVILGGQVYREGDSPADGLRIEQIRQRSVVFDLRGQRFEMPM